MNAIRLSPHAVDRFIQRWRPHLCPPEAAEELRAIALGGLSVGPTVGGELWQADSVERVPFIIRRDPKVGPIVVTVLPPAASMPSADELEEVVAAYQRITASVSTPNGTRSSAPPKPAAPTATAKSIAYEWLLVERARAKENEARLRKEAADLERGRPRAGRPAELSAALQRLNTAEQQRDAALCTVERLRAALDLEDAETKKSRKALKPLLRALLATPENEVTRDALEAVRAIEPGFLVHAFWSGERVSKEERKRQALEADGLACTGRLGALRCVLPPAPAHDQHEADDAIGARVRWT